MSGVHKKLIMEDDASPVMDIEVIDTEGKLQLLTVRAINIKYPSHNDLLIAANAEQPSGQGKITIITGPNSEHEPPSRLVSYLGAANILGIDVMVLDNATREID